VREAINKLVAIRLLDQRQGQGTFVNSPAASLDGDLLSTAMGGAEVHLEDLLEVRLGLECNAVALAARRATEEDIQELEKSRAEMAADIAAGRLGTDADVSFHMAIAYASKNTVQVHIMRSFYNLLFYGIKENLLRLYSSPDDLKRIIEQHTEIVACIRRHDPVAAQDAMRRHINFVLDFFSKGNL
jgi:GntR family transcriptional repressor for pyruvate dehydrogenase complex